MQLIRRGFSHPVKLQNREAPKPGSVGTLTGYIAVFDSDSEDMGGYTERILPGAFAESLSTKDIVGLKNHNHDNVLGRTSSGTLQLSEDATGLAFELDLPDTELGRELVTLVERGDLKGCSFGFLIKDEDQEWKTENGRDYCYLRRVDLFEVSVGVTWPAYNETSMQLRHRQWRESQLKRNRQRDRDRLRNLMQAHS